MKHSKNQNEDAEMICNTCFPKCVLVSRVIDIDEYVSKSVTHQMKFNYLLVSALHNNT